MTQLRNIDRHKLASILVSQTSDANDIRSICADAIDDADPDNIKRLNTDNVVTAGLSPIKTWKVTIAAAEEQELLLQLVGSAKKRYNGNLPLAAFYDEIKDGFEKRIAKIAKAIKENQCVLFIGPEILQCRNGAAFEAFNRYFATQLSNTLNQKGVYYDEGAKDSLSYIATRYEDLPGTINRELGKLAKNAFANATLYKEVYRKIASLKFPLIVSTNPDDLLENEYKARGVIPVVGYYNRSNQDMNATVYDENGVNIYKIFGSFESPFSILFTDDDRVQFSKNVVKNDPKIPPVVKVLLENKYCLFLGFNFEEWHLNILIDCLGLKKADAEERIFALLMDKTEESNIEHFEKSYRFYFINDQIEEFVDDVIEAIYKIP